MGEKKPKRTARPRSAAPARNRIVLVLGRKGSGKSYFVKRELDKLGRHSPLYVWDFNREYAGPTARDPIGDAVIFTSWRAFLEAAAAQAGHLGRVVIQADRRDFAKFCIFVLRAGGATVVLDELHMFAGEPSNRVALQDLFYISRHRRLNVYAVAWRPTSLPPYVRHCFDELVAFHTTEPIDLEWFRQAGLADLVNRVAKLPPREFALVSKPG